MTVDKEDGWAKITYLPAMSPPSGDLMLLLLSMLSQFLLASKKPENKTLPNKELQQIITFYVYIYSSLQTCREKYQ